MKISNIMLYNANTSVLYYKENYDIINDYYQYIVKIIQKILDQNLDLNINITMDGNYNFNNSNKTLNININYEHTLVKKGGRSVNPNTPVGNICDDNNEKYLVRIDNYHVLNNSDIIIDYSDPNIHNVKTCPQYNSFFKKLIYISSSIYEPYFIKENRNIITLTTFINTNELRRKELLDAISNEKIKHINISDCFDKTKLQNIYKNTKILINIHQTPHHHTFEELRVLPALECGVIVISEKSPLNEIIPYNDLIIWANYGDIINKTKEVIDNYNFFHDAIFSIKNINVLCNLPKINYDTLHNAIRQSIDV